MKKPIVAVATSLAGVLFLISSPSVHAQSNTVASLAGYMYPITRAYNGSTEVGEDLGTPQGTPITSLVSGQLVGAGFYAGGGVVTVRTTLNGEPADFYVQHLDSIVNVGLCQYGNCGGQYVSRGELLGYSGGACFWHYGPGFGKFNPCAAGFSDGPHIEIGINPPFYGIWGPSHPGPNYNPYRTVLALINGGGDGPANTSSNSSSSADNSSSSADNSSTNADNSSTNADNSSNKQQQRRLRQQEEQQRILQQQEEQQRILQQQQQQQRILQQQQQQLEQQRRLQQQR